jgi:predicted ATPase/transcriptional regulator with XRE-family HTH domain
MPASFAELLRRFRVGASLTQEALAERCRLSPATIAALETGRRRAPRLSTVADIADALELPPSDRALLARAAADARDALRGDRREVRAVPADGPPELDQAGAAGTSGALGQRTHPTGRAALALPAPITPLVGRLAEASAIADDLMTERLVTLVGPGGVGKTRLALRVASDSAGKFTGGIWWAELGPVSDPGGVVSAVLRAVGGSEQPGAHASAEILAALPDDPLLLVIDNCEHVLDAAANLIGELLRSETVTVLATSREPLTIPGEVTWPVPPLEVPLLTAGAEATAESLSAPDSVRLFVDRAARANPSFRLDDGNVAAVARICRRLDGLPLAIELVAARVRAQPAGLLADELDQKIGLAGTSARGVPDRQSTLRASIGWSYQLLTGKEQAAFRSLACFAGPFTAPACAAVASQVRKLGGHVRHPDELTDAEALARLIDKSLVTLVPSGTAGTQAKYRLLESIREYATERAQGSGELTAIRDAHADYYISWLSGLDTADATDEVLQAIAAEYPNIRVALQWLIERSSERAAALVTAVGAAWHQLSMFHDAVVLGDGALRVVAGQNREAWARAAGTLAMARLLCGDLAFTTAVVPEAGQVARSFGDEVAEGWCLVVQGSQPPFDPARLTSAYELGVLSSPSVGAIAAASLAAGGAVAEAARWSELAVGLTSELGNASLSAVTAVARAEHLIERGQMDESLDLVLPVTTDRRVMPAVRMLAVGRVVHVAFQRCDDRVGADVETTVDELARGWPDRGLWRVGLQGLRMALLRGEPSSTLAREPSGWLMRISHTPGLLRTYCRLAIDSQRLLDPVELARGLVPAEPGSLMAASIAAIRGARAGAEGDEELARVRWTEVLTTAAPNGYLLLVCDALEALGCLSVGAGDPAKAVALLRAAQACRDDIRYRFRFGYEQAAVDEALASLAASTFSRSALTWQAAAALALS